MYFDELLKGFYSETVVKVTYSDGTEVWGFVVDFLIEYEGKSVRVDDWNYDDKGRLLNVSINDIQ